MDKSQFLATVSAVLGGNALTFLFAYCIWVANRIEKAEGTNSIPWRIYAGLIAPPAVLALGAYYYVID